MKRRAFVAALLALLLSFAVTGCGGGASDEADDSPQTTQGPQGPSDEEIVPEGGKEDCIPTSCEVQGKNCGPIEDGCGGTLECGSCSGTQTCGGSGTANVCGEPPCEPTTCAAQGKNCGSIEDGCGGTLQCGTCGSGLVCDNTDVCVEPGDKFGSDCYDYAFVSDRDDDHENVYTAKSCEAAVKKITHNTSDWFLYSNPDFHPNEQKLAFTGVLLLLFLPIPVAEVADLSHDPVTFETVPIDSKVDEFIPFTSDWNGNASKSALVGFEDGEMLLKIDSDPMTIPGKTLVQDNASGTGQFNGDDWVPNDDKLIYSFRPDKDALDFLHLYDVSLGTSKEIFQQCVNTQEKLQGSYPAVKPDKTKLAFVKTGANGKDQIYTCNLLFEKNCAQNLKKPACENPAALTAMGANTHPAWSPDGKYLFFTSDRDGNKEIYMMKADGTEQTNLTHDPADDEEAAIKP